MAGKKQVKKGAAKKKAAAKKAPAKKAPAKKAPAKKAAKKGGAKKVGVSKPARARLASAKPPRAPLKGEKAEKAEKSEGGWELDRSPAEQLGREWEKGWARVVAKTWTDPEFLHALLESPARMLAAEGLPMLRDVDIRIVQGEGRFTMEIPLPPRPEDLDGEIIEDLLGDLQSGKIKPKKCVISSCCC